MKVSLVVEGERRVKMTYQQEVEWKQRKYLGQKELVISNDSRSNLENAMAKVTLVADVTE